MRGKVNARREATIPIRINGKNARPHNCLAVIDTGFTGFLTLPRRTIQRLALPRVGNVAVQLADGKMVRMDVYVGLTHWGGRLVPVRINAAETDPLVGMGLLEGFELRISVRRGGAVILTKLKQPPSN